MEIDKNLSSELDGSALNELYAASKWAKFIAIVGFIFMGLMVVFSFFASSIMSAFPGGARAIPGVMITVIYLVIALIYFFPLYYLYQFADNVKKAHANNDLQFLTTAFSKLRSHFNFIGVLIIIGLAIYVIAFVIMLSSRAFM